MSPICRRSSPARNLGATRWRLHGAVECSGGVARVGPELGVKGQTMRGGRPAGPARVRRRGPRGVVRHQVPAVLRHLPDRRQAPRGSAVARRTGPPCIRQGARQRDQPAVRRGAPPRGGPRGRGSPRGAASSAPSRSPWTSAGTCCASAGPATPAGPLGRTGAFRQARSRRSPPRPSEHAPVCVGRGCGRDRRPTGWSATGRGVGERRAIQPRAGVRGGGRRHPRARGHRVGRPPHLLRRASGPLPPAGHRSSTAGGSAPAVERDGTGRPRVGPGPPGPLPLQRQRVPRGHARLLPGPGGAVQRQLPLRRGGAALPAQRRRGPRLSSTTPPSPPSSPRCSRAPRSRASCSRWPTSRATTCCPARWTTRPPWPPRPELRPVEPTPDDLYILYTGGTTGMPKGVLWRQHDIFRAAMGGRTYGTWELVEYYDAPASPVLPTDASGSCPSPRSCTAPAQWACFYYMTMGGTLVFPANTRSLDAADVWRHRRARARHRHLGGGRRHGPPAGRRARAGRLRRQLAPGLRQRWRHAERRVKERLLAVLPNVLITDVAGASETGAQMGVASTAGLRCRPGDLRARTRPPWCERGPARVLEPGDEEIGLAGPARLGPARLSRRRREDGPHLPRHRRRALLGARRPGPLPRRRRDRASGPRLGDHQFRGREDLRRGGRAGHHRPPRRRRRGGGRPPSERWGQEVVAIVQLGRRGKRHRRGAAGRGGQHLARYKLPRPSPFSPHIVRSPAGKADYRWAKERALEA